MKQLIYPLAALVLLTLGGCVAALPATAVIASLPNSGGDGSAKTAAIAEPGGNLRLGTLKPRKLAAGECGLFLWSKTADQKLVFYGAGQGAARAVLNDRELPFMRARADGREVMGQFEQQTFSHEGYQISVDILFEARAGMSRGAVVSQGTLRLSRTGGWEYIIPVGGLVACEGA